MFRNNIFNKTSIIVILLLINIQAKNSSSANIANKNNIKQIGKQRNKQGIAVQDDSEILLAKITQNKKYNKAFKKVIRITIHHILSSEDQYQYQYQAQHQRNQQIEKTLSYKLVIIENLIKQINCNILSIKNKLLSNKELTQNEKIIFYLWLTVKACFDEDLKKFLPYNKMYSNLYEAAPCLLDLAILNSEFAITTELQDEEILKLLFDCNISQDDLDEKIAINNDLFFQKYIILMDSAEQNTPSNFDLTFEKFDFNKIQQIEIYLK